MKFRIPNKELRVRHLLNKYKNWQRWFAWHPVRVSSSDVRWLEFVERRFDREWGAWNWEYRAIG